MCNKWCNECWKRALTFWFYWKKCKRRLAYLQAATAKLVVNDLALITSAWEKKLMEKKVYIKAALKELKGENASKNKLKMML